MAAASFSQPGSVDSDSPDIVVSKLTEAIQSGNIDDAKIFASFLSKHRVRLKIDVSKDQNCQGDNEEEIEVNVKVEDRVSSGAELVLKVRPSDCIRDLKRMMWVRYRIPIGVQRWIIGKKIADDDTTLKKCGVTGSGFTIFLYVITAHSAQVQPYAENQFENDVLGAGLFSPAMSNTMSFDELGAGPFLDLAYPSRPQRGQHSPHLSPPPVPPRQPIEGDIDPEETHVVQPNQKLRTAMTIDVDNTPKEVGWECPRCTFINLPTRPGCSMCAGNRPEGYVVPEDYQLTEEEQTMVLTQEELERLTRQPVPDFQSQSALFGFSAPLGSSASASAACQPSAPSAASAVNPHHLLYKKFLEDNGCHRGQSRDPDASAQSQAYSDMLSMFKLSLNLSEEDDDFDVSINDKREGGN